MWNDMENKDPRHLKFLKLDLSFKPRIGNFVIFLQDNNRRAKFREDNSTCIHLNEKKRGICTVIGYATQVKMVSETYHYKYYQEQQAGAHLSRGLRNQFIVIVTL